MRFYHLTHKETLKLPLKTFWLLNQNVDRIMAHDEIRFVAASAASQAENGGVEHRKRLAQELGTVFKKATPKIETTNVMELPNAERDEGGVAELKMMARQRIGG